MKPFKYNVGDYVVGFNILTGSEYNRIVHGKVLGAYHEMSQNWYDMEISVGIYKTSYSIPEESIVIVCEA